MAASRSFGRRNGGGGEYRLLNVGPWPQAAQRLTSQIHPLLPLRDQTLHPAAT
jgi:hypothetical protein